MLELGFTPSFYHFVDTIIEVKVSITMSNEISSSLSTFRGSFNSYFAIFAAGASCSSVSASYREQVQLQRRGLEPHPHQDPAGAAAVDPRAAHQGADRREGVIDGGRLHRVGRARGA